jgi:hypothetical protein
MNKIKLLYDIARNMKNREQLSGILQAKVQKDQKEVLTLRNQFEKNDQGKGKCIVSAEFNLDGRHVTRESSTEFDLPGCCGHGPGLMRKFFHGKHGAHPQHCCGIKGFFGRLGAALGILNTLEAEERQDGGARMYLDFAALPDEMKAGLLERMRQKAAHCCDHGVLCQGHELEGVQGRVEVEVDGERKIETATLVLNGTLKDEKNELHPVTAWGEVQFSW